MRAIVTGQVGMNKKDYLTKVVDRAAELGHTIALHNVGDMMYAEAADVAPGRILDLPLSRLNALRRSVFKDIIAAAKGQPDLIVNTHATFRWRHGLFSATDFDQLEKLQPDLFICLVDNIEVVHHRLHAEHASDASLKDVMVWREEEIMATELVARAVGCAGRFYILSRGRHADTIDTMLRLVCFPQTKKVYPSFPMTHVANMPDIQARIDRFRQELAKRFITFDPGDVDEKLLLEAAINASRDGHDFIDAHGLNAASEVETFRVSVKQILDVAGDIDGQIYARDFKLIDQSDMIVSYIPEVPGGAGALPGLSSGVERELHHAFEHGKQVYVVWKPKRGPSPFITETATKVFPSTTDALEHFQREGIVQPNNLFER